MQQHQQSAGDSFANSRVCGKCVAPRRLSLHVGRCGAVFPAHVPESALLRVSVLACGRANFSGILLQAKRPQERQSKHLAAQSAGACHGPKATFIIKRKAKPARRGLTLRSSGAPTAGHQRPVGGTRYVFTVRGLASCRWRPLNSHVRHPIHAHSRIQPVIHVPHTHSTSRFRRTQRTRPVTRLGHRPISKAGTSATQVDCKRLLVAEQWPARSHF